MERWMCETSSRSWDRDGCRAEERDAPCMTRSTHMSATVSVTALAVCRREALGSGAIALSCVEDVRLAVAVDVGELSTCKRGIPYGRSQ